MKTDTIVIIAVAAAGLFFISRVANANSAGAGTGTILNQSNKVNAIGNTALPGQAGWGWSYFTDGTAIGPDGKYYFQGTEVYDPKGYLKVLA